MSLQMQTVILINIIIDYNSLKAMAKAVSAILNQLL